MLHNLACDMGGGRELQTMMRERDLLINAEWQRNKIKNPVKQVTPLTCEGFVITISECCGFKDRKNINTKLHEQFSNLASKRSRIKMTLKQCS